MALTNAERQTRWRERHVITLTDTAEAIAEKLMDMADQKKLRKVARYINDHLKMGLPKKIWDKRPRHPYIRVIG